MFGSWVANDVWLVITSSLQRYDPKKVVSQLKTLAQDAETESEVREEGAL